jgi:hypothetical protein
MTEIEDSFCDRNYRRPFPELSITLESDMGKECYNGLSLGSREERASLLKAGFTGKDIESEYLRLNGIVVIGINWQ